MSAIVHDFGATVRRLREAHAWSQERLAELLPDDNVVRHTLPRNPRLPRKFESGAGGLVSTVADYARFCEMILRGGELDGRGYLKAETFKLMASNRLWRALPPVADGRVTALPPFWGFGMLPSAVRFATALSTALTHDAATASTAQTQAR